MTTKTITITDPKDYREGDLFTATLVDSIRPGVEVKVTGVPLVSDEWNADNRLYAKNCTNYPYADYQKPGDMRYWANVTVTREVEVPELPTEPGIYRGAKWGDRAAALCYTLNDSGEWFIHWSDGSTEKEDQPSEYDLPLVRMVREDGE